MTTVGNVATHSGEKEKAEKRRALGRGLESLLPGPRVVPGTQQATARPTPPPTPNGEEAHSSQVPSDEPRAAALQPEPGVVPMIQAGGEVVQSTDSGDLRSARQPGTLVVNLAIEDVDKNPFQTRYVDTGDSLQELTDSIKANGVLQPIVVRPAEEEGRYVLILGERRLHASKLAGKTTVPAIVRRVSEQQAAEMTIIENLQREDLSPLEQAEAFRLLSEEFKLTQAQIGERVGLSRESVANYMRLLRLPGQVMLLLREKKLNFALAKELLKLGSDDQIITAARAAVDKGMTVEQVERLVLHLSGLDAIPGREKKQGAGRWVDPNVRAAQFELERLLGLRVRIRDRKGKGKIIIEYGTVDDYERIVGALRGNRG